MNREATAARLSTARGRRLALFVIAALLVGIGAWLLFSDDGDSSPGAPQAASAAELRELSASVGHDVYWAGPAPAGAKLELTHEADGRIYVRYLTGEGEVGDSRPRFLTVGTYPVAAAFTALGREAKRPGAITRALPRGGLAYMNADRPTSVYLAWPGTGYEVEVFDPSPKHALDLVLSGAIAPVR